MGYGQTQLLEPVARKNRYDRRQTHLPGMTGQPAVAEEMLKEMAYVLQLTRSIKKAIIDKKPCAETVTR